MAFAGIEASNGSSFLIGIITGLLALLGGATAQSFLAGQSQGKAELVEALKTDAQTGLLSRRGLEDMLEKLLEDQASANALSSTYLVAFEFDSIKDINEVYGQETGDTVIRILGDRLQRIVGELGPVARTSGSEYVVILKAANSERELKVAVDALIEALSNPIKFGSVSLAVFGNAGVVKLANRATQLEVALRCATLARASARGAGRGTWAIYHPEMSQVAAYRKWLESELSAAIQRNELSLRYQPQVDFRTGKVAGYEALLRWQHHEKGAISPVEFIEIAEQCGLMRTIGAWVLKKACIDAMQMADDIVMSVNVSSAQIIETDFCHMLRRTLMETGLPAQRLELEVTESVVISDYTTVRKRFAEIREIGCAIAIDDFGTGYSNLTNLAELPFQKLKIDKSFVDRMIQQRNIGSIVTTIVNLAHSLDAKVIAEGVEMREQAVMLNAAGCSLIQGYYYSKPLTLAEALRLGTTINPEDVGAAVMPAVPQNNPMNTPRQTPHAVTRPATETPSAPKIAAPQEQAFAARSSFNDRLQKAAGLG